MAAAILLLLVANLVTAGQWYAGSPTDAQSGDSICGNIESSCVHQELTTPDLVLNTVNTIITESALCESEYTSSLPTSDVHYWVANEPALCYAMPSDREFDCGLASDTGQVIPVCCGTSYCPVFDGTYLVGIKFSESCSDYCAAWGMLCSATMMNVDTPLKITDIAATYFNHECLSINLDDNRLFINIGDGMCSTLDPFYISTRCTATAAPLVTKSSSPRLNPLLIIGSIVGGVFLIVFSSIMISIMCTKCKKKVAK